MKSIAYAWVGICLESGHLPRAGCENSCALYQV